MSIIENEIREIIELRKQHDSELFFIELKPKYQACGWEVVRRKSFLGISTEGYVVVPAVYDDIVICSEKIAALSINDKYALYDLTVSKYITKFLFVKIEQVGNFFLLRREPGDITLYDVLNNQVLLENGGYDQINIRQTDTEYIWAHRGKFYDFIKRSSGRLISMPGLIMAYDTQTGMYGYGESRRVKRYQETGVEDIEAFRAEVISAGGYLTLNNYTKHITDVSDIYGNIVNL